MWFVWLSWILFLRRIDGFQYPLNKISRFHELKFQLYKEKDPLVKKNIHPIQSRLSDIDYDDDDDDTKVNRRLTYDVSVLFL